MIVSKDVDYDLFFEQVDDDGDPLEGALATTAVYIVKSGSTTYGAIAGTVEEVADGTYVAHMDGDVDFDTAGMAMVKVENSVSLRVQKIPVQVVDGDIAPAFPANFDVLDINVSGEVAVQTASVEVTLAATAFDAVMVESDMNLLQAMKFMAAALLGQVSGATGTQVIIKRADMTGHTHEVSDTRITATVDQHGNRESVVLNLGS